ncbi:kinase-like protein [Gloeophyllum trabeum ATCC 11539]|uniref:non-specific serine/threonine protein kinase n=1 Tax=Gloeophyllum trabeum (strain ATCC 11539 / FP-39264 / Madison 617) TaxID=670483 RepID=S7RLI3_GLOTA|nr:kinase-like protein [Gloeophyllum trabeum ATCC 11539]EPQ53519.1 kinase-like protein [Gloeophyllum trabeum ATCC 11539]
MFEDTESRPSSPDNALVALTNFDSDWHPIFHASNQVVLYNPTSHALSIRKASHVPHATNCPYCNRPFPQSFQREEEDADDHVDISNDHAHVSNYFQLLAVSNEASFRPSSPPSLASPPSSQPSTQPSSRPESRNGARRRRSRSTSRTTSQDGFGPAAMAQGYFARFFKEECRLGMGANGTVYLCQHILDNNPLGHFAVKKIAVGDSHSYLLNILQEIRLLERLHHPNIITYHHAWLEMARFSTFGMEVPTLHVLMQYASGGSLDDFISARLGDKEQSSSGQPSAAASRSARIRAFRERQKAARSHQGQNDAQTHGHGAWKAVHLLSAEEVRRLFGDVVEGLGFLHNRSILHLDLKPGNVLLTYDDGQLIPRAMLSDFGTSRDMLHSKARSGNTGTLEYSSPESLPSPQTGLLRDIDSKSDMWSLGMLLYKMLFFRLPYRYEEGRLDILEKEIQGFPGFRSNSEMVKAFESRRLPRAYLYLLEKLLSPKPSARPSCDKILSAIREGRFDPSHADPDLPGPSSLVPAHRRPGAGPASGSPPATDAQQTNKSTDSRTVDAPNSSITDQHTVSEKDKESVSGEDHESTPLLGLPPVEVGRWGNLWLRMTGLARITPPAALRGRVPRILLHRTLKSGILVAKVLSFTSSCPNPGSHPILLASVLTFGIMDTWFDGYQVSAFLGAMHAIILWLSSKHY